MGQNYSSIWLHWLINKLHLETLIDSLANVVLSARLNHNKSLYRQSGKKIKNILGM